MTRKPIADWEAIWIRLQAALINKEVQPAMQACADLVGVDRATLRDQLRKHGITAADLKLFYGKPDVEAPEGGSTYEESDNEIHVVCASRRMLTQEDVIREHKIDMKMWRVKSFRVKTSEGYRKDRSVEWDVTNGVANGHVHDTGRMLVVPMHHLELVLERRTEEIRVELLTKQMIEDAKNYAPKYEKMVYPKQAGKAMYEIDMPDIHFGRLTWNEESGEDYDIKIAEKIVIKVMEGLLSYTALFPIKKIVLPLGNDFFNVNTHTNTTVGGTPQQEDTRWSKTYRRGVQLMVKVVEMCSQIAPVDVLIIKGNHDEERTFYMGEYLYAWFHQNQDVFIDNRALGRKYYLYGKNLIGFTHGDGGPSKIKLDKYASLMPSEVPDLWAKSNYREWHLGHIHHKFETKEENGVVVRFLRSLVPADAWTYDNGFTGQLRAAEAFVWDYDKGLQAQFTVTP